MLPADGRRAARERQDGLEVLVVEAKLQPEKIVSQAGLEEVVDPSVDPQTLEELVGDVHAVARLDLLAEAEEVVDDLESILQEVDVEAEAAGRLLDPEAPRERPHALGDLEREP